MIYRKSMVCYIYELWVLVFTCYLLEYLLILQFVMHVNALSFVGLVTEAPPRIFPTSRQP
jgi:hypothetical protein